MQNLYLRVPKTFALYFWSSVFTSGIFIMMRDFVQWNQKCIWLAKFFPFLLLAANVSAYLILFPVTHSVIFTSQNQFKVTVSSFDLILVEAVYTTLPLDKLRRRDCSSLDPSFRMLFVLKPITHYQNPHHQQIHLNYMYKIHLTPFPLHVCHKWSLVNCQMKVPAIFLQLVVVGLIVAKEMNAVWWKVPHSHLTKQLVLIFLDVSYMSSCLCLYCTSVCGYVLYKFAHFQ